jgi:hypothetical protein
MKKLDYTLFTNVHFTYNIPYNQVKHEGVVKKKESNMKIMN